MVNGKFYWGVHRMLKYVDSDCYLGSGKELLEDIEKYGIGAFVRQTMHVFDSADDAYAKEAEIVTYALVIDPLCYNINLGGRSGFIKGQTQIGQ